MLLKSTKDCKEFIALKVGLDSTLKDELLAHDIHSWSSDKWSRTTKKKIKSDDEVAWLIDPIFREFSWLEPGRKTLVGCTLRGFLHKNGDCYVGLITNDKDELVAWAFQLD